MRKLKRNLIANSTMSRECAKPQQCDDVFNFTVRCTSRSAIDLPTLCFFFSLFRTQLVKWHWPETGCLHSNSRISRAFDRNVTQSSPADVCESGARDFTQPTSPSRILQVHLRHVYTLIKYLAENKKKIKLRSINYAAASVCMYPMSL